MQNVLDSKYGVGGTGGQVQAIASYHVASNELDGVLSRIRSDIESLRNRLEHVMRPSSPQVGNASKLQEAPSHSAAVDHMYQMAAAGRSIVSLLDDINARLDI